MFRILGFIATLLIAAALLWPYYTLYRLDNALANFDQASLNKLVNLEAVRKVHKDSMGSVLDRALGPQAFGQLPMVDMLRKGLNAAGDSAVDSSVDLQWIRDTLYPPPTNHAKPGLLGALSFAFFESPTRFLVRLGELGTTHVHFYLTLEDWNWRVTAVYRSVL
jgi:hypothetical protein